MLCHVTASRASIQNAMNAELSPAAKAARTRQLNRILKSGAYIAANHELRQAEASLAYDTRDPRRIARHAAAQAAVSKLLHG